MAGGAAAVGRGVALSQRSQCAWLLPPGKAGEQDSTDSGTDGFESSDSLLQSWNSQSSLLDVQRVPSFESFEDDCSQSLCLSKPTMSFKDYIQERSDPAEQGKPVIPAAVLAGFTGECHPGAPAATAPGPALPPRAWPGRLQSKHIMSTPHVRPGRWNSEPGRALSLNLTKARLAGGFLGTLGRG